jgi:hypothetical protein
LKFAGELKFPDIDHPGVPVQFVIDDAQAELIVEGESLGRWSLYDVRARRLVASAFEIDLDGTELTFVASDPIDFAYRGVEHMAGAWAEMKTKRLPTRSLAVRKSRKGIKPSRIEDLRAAMESNLEESVPRPLAGEPAMPRSESPVLPTVRPDSSGVVEGSFARDWDIPSDRDESVGPESPDSAPDAADQAFRARSQEELALEAERRALAEERARLEEERRAAEQREANLVEAYRLEVERLEAEREELRRQAAALEGGTTPGSEEDESSLEATRRAVEEDKAAAERDAAALAEMQREAAEREERERQTAEREAALKAELDRRVAEREAREREAAEREEAERAAREKEAAGAAEEGEVAATGSGFDAAAFRRGVVDLDDLEDDDGQSPAADSGRAPVSEPEPALSGAPKEKSGGLMGAVKAAFRGGTKDHEHRFVEAPGGIGITRYVCEECGYVSISA